jgi:beta-galactosidase/beta-glucuronidase
MNGRVDISIEDANEVEARVVATYIEPSSAAAAGPVTITGRIIGPFCQGSHTLPAQIEFWPIEQGNLPQAQVVVPDPCLWSPELPHVYRVDVEARRAGQMVAEYHGQIGLRRSQPRQRDILISKRSDEDRRRH